MLSRVALALLLGLACACAPAIDTLHDDAALTAAVATALLNTPDIDGTRVSIRVSGGVVRLSGTQPTADAVARAVSIVKGVQGVREVESAIEVGD